MAVREATTETEIQACYPVMHQLRDHLDEEAFVRRVQDQRDDGYRLVYVEEDGDPVAVAGFRILEMLSRGRFLYVDDLVTAEEHRGRGFGTQLVEWLIDHAREAGCRRVDLDSGVQRGQAHRFYHGRGFQKSALHFKKPLDSA